MKGQAIDRYFVGLKMVAKEAGIEIHDFFKDEGFLKSLHYNLNTSQVCILCTLCSLYNSVAYYIYCTESTERWTILVLRERELQDRI